MNSHTTTANLPALDYTILTTDAELATACAHWQHSSALALDTEFMRVSTFYPELGLLQVADAGAVTLVDPLGIRDWEPFKALMLDQGIVKVLHSCSEDLLVFFTFLRILPSPVFDTQIAGALLNQGNSLSYQNLVKMRFGVELPKGETRSDWLQRPLTPEQLDYAALDVAYLYRCWQDQQSALQQQGRDTWMQEECNRLLGNYESEFTHDYSDYYLNFKSAWQLRPRPLLALQKLAVWREERARKRNRPRSWILKDNALFAIANSMVVSRTQLAAMEDVSDNFVRHEGDSVLAIVQQAREAAEADCPPPLPQPLTNGEKQLLKRMQDLVEQRAGELGLPQEIVGRKRALMPLLYAVLALPPDAAVDESVLPQELTGWRREVILHPLLKLLRP